MVFHQCVMRSIMRFLYCALSAILISVTPFSLQADGHGHQHHKAMSDKDYQSFKQQGPFNYMYPKLLAKESAKHFDDINRLFSDSVIPTKYAELAGLSASVAARCEYCILHHTTMAKKAGANEEEIKTAIMIAAEMTRMSTLLYGNEFSLEKLKSMYQEK